LVKPIASGVQRASGAPAPGIQRVKIQNVKCCK